MTKKDFFKKEIKRRGEVDKATYAMVGAEIKRLRLKSQQTLSNLAENLCSVSYVCKIERAQIKPNKYMLGEIFKRLDASDNSVQSLFDLKDFITDSVKWYYERNTKKFEEVYSKIKGLDNYRTTLFMFIYSIYKKDLLRANLLINDIYKIANIMTNNELYIFLFFASIIEFYEENYSVVVDNLKIIAGLEPNNYLGILAYAYIFKSYFKMNNPMCLIYGEYLSDFFLKNLDFEKGEEIRYLCSLYKVWNGMKEVVYKEMNMLKEKKYRATLDFYIRIQNPKFRIKNFISKKHLLSPFARLLLLYVMNDESYFKEYIELDKNKEFEIEYSHNIAHYLSLQSDEDKIEDLVRVVLPNIEYKKNALEKNFFLNQLCNICLDNTKYKLFCVAYKQLLSV